MTVTLLITGLPVSMTALWIVAIVVFLVVEAATAGLVTIWFAVGALAALLASLCNAPVWLQLVWFFTVSIAAFALTRPLARKYLNSRTQPTNADMLIGHECLVTEEISTLAGRGAVSVGGKIWSARAADGGDIPAGALVTVLRIEGVKLIVEPKDNGSPAKEEDQT